MATTANLRSCQGRIDRPVGFCATAVGQPILPGLSIDGFGMVALPLDASQARVLESRGSLAGYGQGRNTDHRSRCPAGAALSRRDDPLRQSCVGCMAGIRHRRGR